MYNNNDRFIYSYNNTEGSFYRLPKELLESERYANVSVEAKMLYSLLLDRTCISIKNGWIDSDKRAYIIFTVEDICKFMACGRTKANDLLNELDEVKGCDLIRRVRQGNGRPNIIYVKKVEKDNRNKDKSHMTADTDNSRKKTEAASINCRKCVSDDIKTAAYTDISCNNTANTVTQITADTVTNNNNINNNINNYHHSVNIVDEDELMVTVKQQIEYDHLVETNAPEKVDMVVHYLVDGLAASGPQTRIHNRMMSTHRVKEVLSKLRSVHIQTLLTRLNKIRTEIINMRSYMLTAMYDVFFSAVMTQTAAPQPCCNYTGKRQYNFPELERMLIEN